MNGFNEDFDGWDNLHITRRNVKNQANRWRHGTKHGAKTKSQAWEIVAQHAQQLARLRSANRHGIAYCFTCKNQRARKWNEGLEGGHWIKRQVLPTKTLQANLRPQCHFCNNYRGGEQEIFKLRLGERITTRLQRIRHANIDWSFEQIAKRLLVIRYRIKQHKERMT